MSTSILPAIRREDRLVLEISDLRKELDRIVSIEELQEASSRLSAMDAYSKAKNASDMTDRAVEARVWVERRAGELAKQQGLTGVDIVRQFGVHAGIATQWKLFAAVSKEQLEAAIETIRTQRELSISGIRSQLLRIEEETGHPGVVRLADGRFRISWDKAGVRNMITCKEGMTLQQARGRLKRLMPT